MPATQQSRRVGGSATSRQPGECAARDYSRSPSPSMPVNKGFHSPSSAWRIRGRSSSGGVQRRASAARSSSAERSSPSLSLAAPCIDQRRIISVVTKPPSRFAPYDTSWGSSNPGSKQSEPDIARRDRARRAASRPVLDPMRRRQHLRSIVVVLVLLALVLRIVLLARIVGDDLRGGQSGRCTIRQIRLAHTRLDQDSKA